MCCGNSCRNLLVVALCLLLVSFIAPVSAQDPAAPVAEVVAPEVPAVAVEAPVVEEEEVVVEESMINGLALTLNLDWAEKYMFRGFNILQDDSAWQPSLDVALFDSGIHFNIWGSIAAESRDNNYPGISNEDLDEIDYWLYYTKDTCDGAFNIQTGIYYYTFPEYPSSRFVGGTNEQSYFLLWDDLEYYETYGILTMNCVPLKPHVGVYYGWGAENDYPPAGTMVDLGLAHNAKLCNWNLCGEETTLELALSADVWYNSGQYVNVAGSGVDGPGWSHAQFRAALPIPVGGGLTFTPAINYQYMIEDDPAKGAHSADDEVWTVLSLSKSF